MGCKKCEKVLKKSMKAAENGNIEDALRWISDLNLPAIIEIAFKQIPLEQYKEYIREQNKKETKIYFLQSTDTGNIKIGKTKADPKKRIMQFQGMIPGQVEIIKYVVDKTGSLEGRLHKKFKHLRLENKKEWFKGEKDLLKYIEAL